MGGQKASSHYQRFRKVVWICGLSSHPIFSPGGSAASDVPASLGLGQSSAIRVAGGRTFRRPGFPGFLAFVRLLFVLVVYPLKNGTGGPQSNERYICWRSSCIVTLPHRKSLPCKMAKA